MRTQAEVITAFSGLVLSSRPLEGGSGAARRLSYLANANSRPNLTVLINATVMKLLQSGTKDAPKSFRSVQFSGLPGMQPLFLKIIK